MFSAFYEPVLLLATAAGAAIGGWIDFKTSEIPDEVPLFIAGSALLLHILNGLLGSGWQMLLYGTIVGLCYLAFGYLLYYGGQWGEADVLLLAAIGFALPQPLSFFNAVDGLLYPFLFLINTFIVGAAYSLLYSFGAAFMTKDFVPSYLADLRRNSAAGIGIAATVLLLMTVAGLAVGFSPVLFTQGALYGGTVVFLYLLYRFAHVVDKTVFRRTIKTSQLREGDVLAEDIPSLKLSGKLFIGLTKQQIAQIQRKKSTVAIKEGVRYAPTFFLSILFTLFVGDMFLFLLGSL